jgi:uncharacterized membrane-anchored protein YitT (DUF2179 family)
MSQIINKNNFFSALFMIAGIFSAGFGLKGFLLPNRFLDGGVTGISLMVNEFTFLPISLLLVIFNIPFIIMGYRQISKSFAIKTLFAITGLAVCIWLVPFPIVTQDKLLISVFGGFFLGLGIGFNIRGGAVLDGTEVLAIFISKKSSLTVGEVILVFNLMIFSIAAFLFGVEVALYAILTYISASKSVDFIVEGIEQYIQLTIISEFSEDIRCMIIEKIGRGVTVYKGEKGYGTTGEKETNFDILYTVVTRLELQKLLNEIDKLDAKAFIVQSGVTDTKGGMIKKRPLH